MRSSNLVLLTLVFVVACSEGAPPQAESGFDPFRESDEEVEVVMMVTTDDERTLEEMRQPGEKPRSLVLSFERAGAAVADEAETRAFLEQHCMRCHGGEKVKGKVDFTKVDFAADADLWEKVAEVLEYEEMPPEDEPQPEKAEREAILGWYRANFVDVEPRAGDFQPRRLSAREYENTMESLFGFELKVNIREAEQTIAETSLVMKLLPTDPPGASGFVNDTHNAPISTVLWDQYSYIADIAIQRFVAELPEDAAPAEVIREFRSRAFRRPIDEDPGEISDLSAELKAILMSPRFLYRGLLVETQPGQQLPVDNFELAERLSYFLWADMPDAELIAAAADGSLTKPEIYAAQIDRMLASPKAKMLAESFGVQWLLLDEIDDITKEPIQHNALKAPPIEFLNYLFTQDRPVMELIDSRVTFANDRSAGFYPKDRKQMKKYSKGKGIERVAWPPQQLLLENTPERGGILTMPGVLAMNHGPIIRGTWMLRHVLGEDLGEPPPDIPPITAVPNAKNLTFRQKFEAHRSNAACARCHDKIDPIGFALQAYDNAGAFKPGPKIDTTGKLPSGETFADFAEFKEILLTTKREQIIHHAVEQTMAYALCRKLEPFDRPTVDAIAKTIHEKDGTWRDLFHAVANSLPFRETRFPES